MAPVISWVEVIGAFCVIWILKIKESSRCMYISTLKLLNFRSFKGEQEFHFTDGKNFVVGNNNVGKTTIFEAVDFLFNDLKRNQEIDYLINNDDATLEVIGIHHFLVVCGLLERGVELKIEAQRALSCTAEGVEHQ